MKAVFGEYSAFTTKNNLIRYQKDGKLVSENIVPPDVVAYLSKKLQPKFPMPSKEELAKMREESLKVKPELQREEYEIEAFEALAEEAIDGSFNPPLTDEVIEAVASESIGTETTINNQGEPVEAPIVNPDFLESVSIHTASIQDIAEALYNRFGVYTVYLNRLPADDEVNPLTGEQFTKYHLGIAYQASIYAQNKGILKDPSILKKQIDSSREYSKGWQVDEAPRTMAEARKANSFDYRTSVVATRVEPTTEIVHERGEDGIVRAVQKEIPKGQTGEFNGAKGQYDAEQDQVLVEPQFGKQVIRPNW